MSSKLNSNTIEILISLSTYSYFSYSTSIKEEPRIYIFQGYRGFVLLKFKEKEKGSIDLKVVDVCIHFLLGSIFSCFRTHDVNSYNILENGWDTQMNHFVHILSGDKRS